jgi:GTP-binding protein YchF
LIFLVYFKLPLKITGDYLSLGIGIVGLPNVGKSTLFNALTKAQNAEAANYPFCTIEPNKAVVALPDERLEKLASLIKPAKFTHSTVDFVDIAGLVKGASKGEGLGNQFLSNIRETEAILQVVRCFDDPDVVHVDGDINPLRDIEVIETELLLADIQTLERKIEKLAKTAKGDKTLQSSIDDAKALLKFLNDGQPASIFPGKEKDTVRQLMNELRLMTSKKTIYCANVDEKGLSTNNEYVLQVAKFAESRKSDWIKISAKVEEELIGLRAEDVQEFLDSYGVKKSSLEKVIRISFHTLGLISFFTGGPKEVRAWTIRKGEKAQQAAGEIHSDFEKGFIRAEVISYSDYIKYGSEAACRAAGVMRVEGKDYIVHDGDVIHFLFNV